MRQEKHVFMTAIKHFIQELFELQRALLLEHRSTNSTLLYYGTTCHVKKDPGLADTQ